MQNTRPALSHRFGKSTGMAALLLAGCIFSAPSGAVGGICELGFLCETEGEGATCLLGECRQLTCREDPASGNLLWQHGRFLPEGTACGDPGTAQCSGPDGCDGLGTCLPNDFIGTPCGPPGDLCGLGQCLAATLVNSTADKNDLDPGNGICNASEDECTLRAALQETNATVGAEAVQLPGGIFELTIAESLLVSDELLLLGAGDDATSIDASGVAEFTTPILVVEPVAANVAISGVTIRDGVVTDEFGIANSASLIFEDSTVSNVVSDAAIFNAESLRMIRSSVTGNQGRYAGGMINNEEAVATLTESEVSGNRSFEFGGIFNLSELMLLNSTVSGNQRATASDPEFSGGGIENFYGNTTVVESTVSGNEAVYGGGIENYFGTLMLVDSTVSGNQAAYGGGIANEGGPMTITNSTISGNQAYYGGGILDYYTYSYSFVTNSTISGNTAYVGGGAASVGYSWLIFYSSSVVDNQALDPSGGGGGFADRDEGMGIIAMVNTILAKNTAGEGTEEAPSNCSGDISSGPHNLVDDESCPDDTGDDVIVDDALLGPLADNGGPTQTHLPLPGSPAIDACLDDFSLATDQRGISRPQDGNDPPDGEAICDIGSVEVVPEPGGTLFLGAALVSLAAVRRLRARA